MLLMIDKHFREAPFTWKQRVAFWAAFLYYMSSAALLFTGPFPTLTMMWFFPQQVYPRNYLVILPSIAATLFAFPMLTSGWRPTIYRVCVINSCCHLYAIWYAIRGRVADWVPTGASRGKDLVPVVVSRILRTWIVTEQTLLWSSLALRLHEFGWRPYWATLALSRVPAVHARAADDMHAGTPAGRLRGCGRHAGGGSMSTRRRRGAAHPAGTPAARPDDASQKERPDEASRKRRQVRPLRAVIAAAVVIVLAAIIVAVRRHNPRPLSPPRRRAPSRISPAPTWGCTRPTFLSYDGVTAFTTAPGSSPTWSCTTAGGLSHSASVSPRPRPARRGAARSDGAERLNLAAIAAGKYDGYLSQYAAAVRPITTRSS